MNKTLYILLALIIIANVGFLNWQFYKSINKEEGLTKEQIVSLVSDTVKEETSEKFQEFEAVCEEKVQAMSGQASPNVSPTEQGKPGSVTYQDGDTALSGYFVPAQCNLVKKQPVVLVIHHSHGLITHTTNAAKRIAEEQCYSAFAIDLYGEKYSKIKQPIRDKKVATKLMMDIWEDPEASAKRLNAAIEYLKTRNDVDLDRIAVIGYIGGGNFASRMAYTNPSIKAAVAFHNNLNNFELPDEGKAMKTPIQIHVGKEDKRISPDTVKNLKAKINDLGAPISIYEYDGVGEHFTFPEKFSGDVTYDKKADNQSWNTAFELINKVFSKTY